VVDDRADVWRGPQRNHLLLVKPFRYFTEGVEVNNLPGVDSAVDACDEQLFQCSAVVRCVHELFFEAADTGAPTRVDRVLSTLTRRVLDGCRLLIQDNAKAVYGDLLSDSARTLGAVVQDKVDAGLTHVLTVAPPSAVSSEDATSALSEVWVVHPDWLLHSRWDLLRAKETKYCMGRAEDYPQLLERLERSSSSSSSSRGVGGAVVGESGVEASDDDEEFFRDIEKEIL
jgi:hypothetical protein